MSDIENCKICPKQRVLHCGWCGSPFCEDHIPGYSLESDDEWFCPECTAARKVPDAGQ